VVAAVEADYQIAGFFDKGKAKMPRANTESAALAHCNCFIGYPTSGRT
jgi:hypothetical protein